jgi:hypothetical protein
MRPIAYYDEQIRTKREAIDNLLQKYGFSRPARELEL